MNGFARLIPNVTPPKLGLRRLVFLGFACTCAWGSLGCKNTGNNGEGKSGGLGILGRPGSEPFGDGLASTTSRDPLLGKHRIPPQNLPTSGGKDGGFYTSNDGLPADPLFRNPAPAKSGPQSPKAASLPGTEKLGQGEPYRPGPEVTSAALAGFSNGNELVIDDRRPLGTPTSGPIPLKPIENTARPVGTAAVPTARGLTVDMLTEELRKIGARPYAPVKLQNGDYEFQCAVPINDAGAMRSYSGTGATPLLAVRNVYEQIRKDDRR